MITPNLIFYALLGGFLPAIIWLYFWLGEDAKHPEPKGRIIFTFVFGALAIYPALFFEFLIVNHTSDQSLWLVCAVIIEESLKFAVAYFTALRTRFFDEPIDAVVYMITAALGFAALENMYYITTAVSQGSVLDGLVTGNIRFIGSTLAHILSSGVLAIFIGLTYYRSKRARIIYGIIGFILACLLHITYNFFIIVDDPNSRFLVLASVWISAVLLILLIERIKFIKKIKPYIK